MRSRIFLALALVGFVAPLVLFGIYFGEHGVDIGELTDAATANTVAVAMLVDLTISCLAFFIWASREGPRLGIKRWWMVIPATLLVGLCFGLPLFLYWRERALEAGAPPA